MKLYTQLRAKPYRVALRYFEISKPKEVIEVYRFFSYGDLVSGLLNTLATEDSTFLGKISQIDDKRFMASRHKDEALRCGQPGASLHKLSTLGEAFAKSPRPLGRDEHWAGGSAGYCVCRCGRRWRQETPVVGASVLMTSNSRWNGRANAARRSPQRWASRQGNVRQTVPIIGGEM